MRMLDLFCGRWGWSRAFAARGWECVGVDLAEPSEIPERCTFIKRDVMELTSAAAHHWSGQGFDFICASSPCEEFSVWGMAHFHPNPKYPALGIRLFNHTREICEASGTPYVMENVRPAQSFVGMAKHYCGPFALWGNGVPVLMPQGINKGMSQARERDENGKRIYAAAADRMWSTKRKQFGGHYPSRTSQLCGRICRTNLRGQREVKRQDRAPATNMDGTGSAFSQERFRG